MFAEPFAETEKAVAACDIGEDIRLENVEVFNLAGVERSAVIADGAEVDLAHRSPA